MRNVFDQYSQPENRLTHALACTLDADRSLLRPFLRWCGIRKPPPASGLHITEQQVPGEAASGDEGEGRGLPDICIFDDESWALVIESKVQSGISVGQIRRHLATAMRHGFQSPHGLLLCVDSPPTTLPDRTEARQWCDLYSWFRRRADDSPWARTLTHYMETFESRMLSEEYSIRGTITMFDGLRFDEKNPYTYREAKRLLKLLGDELQSRKDLQSLGIDRKGKRRTAITGRQASGVWDFIPLKAARGSTNFTSHPHLTFSLNTEGAHASVTVPNGIRGGFRTRLKEAGEEGFLELLQIIEQRLRPVLKRAGARRTEASGNVYALQRHYPSQSSAGIIDARLSADLRTVVPGRSTGGVRHQPQWAQAIYRVLVEKRSNIQLGVSAVFPYECEAIRSPKAADLFAESWKALVPVVEFATPEPTRRV